MPRSAGGRESGGRNRSEPKPNRKPSGDVRDAAEGWRTWQESNAWWGEKVE